MPSSHVSAEVEQMVGSKSLEFRGKVFLLERIRRQEESLEFEKCGKIKFILSHVLSCFKASVLLLPPWGVLLAFLISPSYIPLSFPYALAAHHLRPQKGCHDPAIWVPSTLIQVFFFLFCLPFITITPSKFLCPLQYSCLEQPMDRGSWQDTVHRATKS